MNKHNKLPVKCKYTGAPDCVGCPLFISSISGRKAFEKIVKIISKADDPVRADLLHAARAKFPFIEEAIDKLGVQCMEELHYNVDEIKRRLRDMDDRSKAATAFAMLKYEPGSFHTWKDVTRDLKQASISMGEARRSVHVEEIMRFYKVKLCRRKINGFFEYGYLILEPREDG